MNLYFQNRFGKKRKIADANNKKEALKAIRDFCNSKNYIIRYIREWGESEYIKYDVGSHTEFFLLEKEEKK